MTVRNKVMYAGEMPGVSVGRRGIRTKTASWAGPQASRVDAAAFCVGNAPARANDAALHAAAIALCANKAAGRANAAAFLRGSNACTPGEAAHAHANAASRTNDTALIRENTTFHANLAASRAEKAACGAASVADNHTFTPPIYIY